MCGIAGIILRQGQVKRQELEAMAGRLAHRGPDENGYFEDGPLGLAHTRLSIIDLEGGRQPLQSQDKSLTLVANGEIYNFVELREELENRGCRFATRSDSETIIHAYEVFGDDFLSQLHGMFAFALYDRPAKRLLLARDRLGIKPLFYAILPDRVVFASEIKALLPVLPNVPEISPQALGQYMQNQFHTGENTILRGVKRLLPGQVLSVDLSLRAEIRTYWSPCSVKPRKLTFDEACEEFEPLITQVIKEHVRSDVPYGLFLSGGVDSAVLLALLDRFQDQPVRTFSVGYDNARMKDELDEASLIAGHFRTIHTPLRLNQQDIFHRLPQTVWAADDLMRDYASLPTSALAEYAGKELKVVFSGEGGDEVFAGYRRYRNSLESTLKGLIYPGSGGFRTRGQLRQAWVRRLFSPPLKKACRSARQPFRGAWDRADKSWSRIQKCQYVDLTTALPDNLLVKADRMLMSYGVEGRVPFLDHRVVEFGLSLSDDLKIQGKQGKVFLKRWAEKYLPKDYLRRPKRGFHVPVGEWLSGEFVAQLGQKLVRNQAVQSWFDARAVGELCRRQAKDQGLSREVWSLMQFAIWHRLFIEGASHVPTGEENPLDWIS